MDWRDAWVYVTTHEWAYRGLALFAGLVVGAIVF